MTRSELINLIIKQNNYKKYLEIGVNTPAQPGFNFNNINTEIKHGVDPNINTTFKMTSDVFFKNHINMKYDIIFIDGLHLFEQAYRDIINSLKWLEDNGTIVVHDCNPTKEITQRRERASNAWHGDVWKAILKLRINNPNVTIYTVDTDEGCAIIKKGSQERFIIKDKEEYIYNYDFFNKNRRKILNLISTKEFRKRLNRKVIIKLQGGLGNQMFQYAIGRHLAEKNNINLKFDLSFYKKQQKNTIPRKYSLRCFNITENIATDAEIKKLKKHKWRNGKRYFLHNLLFANKSIYIKEKQFNFNSKILKIKNSVYLDGYWQSEKYFKDIEKTIHKEFTLKNKFQIKNTTLKEKIKNTNSVSIHIRRNDYATNEKINNVYGLCSLNYYKQALQKISNEDKNLHIFVFSDDIDWVKNNLKTKFPTTFIEGNKDYEDLILMSLCKQNIIANSSFSWWGAWLNQNPDKIVIAPKKWFNNSKINTKDLIPKSWVKI